MATNKDCQSCENLREYAPEFVLNGVTDNVCASLANDTGFNPSSGHNDCEDLDDANDCLIGNMEDEVDAYDVCDWKEFMKKFIPNVWTVIKAMICSMCGQWSFIHCVHTALKNLIAELNATTQGSAFVRYFRDQGRVSGFWWDLVEGETHTIDVYMDADGSDYGNKPADRDYIVNIANCTNMLHFYEAGVSVTYYASDDTRSLPDIRESQAQHAAFRERGEEAPIMSFSWTTSGSVLVRKGAHIKINSYVDHADTYDSEARYRLHQFVMTWVPVNIDSKLDPSKIIPC